MAEGLNIDANLGVKGFLRGTKDMSDALEDVSKDLKDTSKDGVISIDKITNSLDDLAKEAKTTGNKTGDNLKKGFKEASEGAQEFKDEAKSTAKEAAASFDGSAESIIDAFQEIAANAFAGFGAAGLVAGAVVAAGIGTATAAFQANEEAAQAAKQRVRDFGISIIESGDAAAALEYVNNNLKLIVTNADEAPKKFDDIRKIAKETGLAAGTLAQAYAGNEEAIKLMSEAAQDAYDQEIEDLRKARDANAEANDGYSLKSTRLEEVAEKLKTTQDELEAAKQVETDWLASGGAEFLAKQEAITNINDAYDDTVNSVTDYINAETGVLDVEAYLAAIDARKQALADYQNNLAASNLTTEQKAALNDMGIEAASAWLAGYEQASPENKRRLEASLTEAASDSSGAALGVIEETFKKPVDAKVKAVADTTTAQRELDDLVRARTAIIKLDFQDVYGKRVY